MSEIVTGLAFPTRLHEQVAELALEFFSGHSLVDTVLVVNSCARGQAVPESDLDLAVLVRPDVSAAETQTLDEAWRDFAAAHPAVARFRQSGPFAHVHVDLFDGRLTPSVWDEGGGPDTFEVEVGNRVAYAAPFGAVGPSFRRLQSEWLPYYADDLRQRRLAMVRHACAYDLDHVPFFHGRGLHFQAFDRLYKAFQEFLQALFIAHRVYPLMYTKWIREQIRWLGLPDLYPQLPPLLSVGDIESDQVVGNALALRALLDRLESSR
jgi:predicted nucleotidyltransferase